MNSRYEEFISSLSSSKSASVARSLSALGDYDYTNCDAELVTQAILSTHPTTVAFISTVCSYLKRYAEFIGNEELVKIIVSLDRQEILKRCKPKSRFISHHQLQEILHDIDMWEEHNSLYYQSLFWSIYEGVYSPDMSVIKNLRASDIDGEFVTLHHDSGDKYELMIPTELANRLIELADIDVWEQTARYGYIQLPLRDENSDSCFKLTRREGSEITMDRIREFYYRRLRKISADYVGYYISPQNIYVSGIMYRLRIKLNEAGYSLQDAFRFNRKKAEISNIISEELKYSRYWGDVKAFKQLVVGYLDVFEE